MVSSLFLGITFHFWKSLRSNISTKIKWRSQTDMRRVLLLWISTVSLKLEIVRWMGWMTKSLNFCQEEYYFSLIYFNFLKPFDVLRPYVKHLLLLWIFACREWLFNQVPQSHAAYKELFGFFLSYLQTSWIVIPCNFCIPRHVCCFKYPLADSRILA